MARFRKLYWLFRMLRFQDWATIPLAGILTGAFLAVKLQIDLSMLFEAMIYYGACVSFIFGLNECFDADMDAKSARTFKKPLKNPISAGHVSFSEGITFSVFVGLLGVVVTQICFSFEATFIYSISLILGILYSVPPARLKSRPPLDLISHGVCFGILCPLFGYSVFKTVNMEAIILMSPLFFVAIVPQLYNQLTDYEVDLSTNVMTTTCLVGIEKAINLTVTMFFGFSTCLLLLCAAGFMPLLLSLFSLYSCVAWYLLKPYSKKHGIEKAIKVNYVLYAVYYAILMMAFAFR